MISKGKLGLIALIILGALYSYFGIFKVEQKEEQEKIKSTTLIPFDVMQISEFIISKGDKQILIKSTQEGWSLQKPVEDTCNQGFTNNFVSTMKDDKALRELGSGEKIIWADYGLDNPKGYIEIKNNAGKIQKISVGSINNFAGESFLRLNDENRVLLASPDWTLRLDRSEMDFREKSMLRDFHEGVTEIDIKGSKEIHLKKEKEDWKLIGHEDFQIDPQKVDGLFKKLKDAQAKEYLSSLEVPEGKPFLKINLANRDQAFAASVYKRKSGYLVASGKYIMVIEDVDFDKLMNYNIEDLKLKSKPKEG